MSNEDRVQSGKSRGPKDHTPKGICELANSIISHCELRQHGKLIIKKLWTFEIQTLENVVTQWVEL